MLKRFGLFVLVNFGIIMMLMIVTRLLGLGNYLTANGLDYTGLFLFCLVWGMGGAFISLAISKQIAKWTMGLSIIAPDSTGVVERRLYEMVARLAKMANLKNVPEVAIYDSPEINAFATGPTRNNALVAVSAGLLHSMNDQEVEGVLGHEIAHIANGDMVTMTLLQGVMNAFVMFFSKALAWIIANSLKSRDDDSGPSYFLIFGIEMALYIVFGFISAMIVSAFSRYREYAADKGGASIAGTGKMIAALERLKVASTGFVDTRGGEAMATMKISDGRRRSITAMFSTHPSLEDRISRLRGY